MDNFIRIEADAPNAIDDTSFSMSVTNCHVENSTYLIDAVPSTIRFPLTKDGAKSREGNGFFTPLQGNVAFDYTIALDSYRLDMRRQVLVDVSSAAENLSNEKINNNTLSHCVTSTEFKNTQIDSIAQLLDQEARFLKTALVALGFFGVAVVTAFIWTGLKIAHKNKRRVRMVDSVPHDIDNSQFHRAVTPLMSPLRPVRSTCHETLHLISIREEEKSKNAPVASPRHWYEEFLSPRINDKINATTTTDVAATVKDVASRALFSGKKCDASGMNEVEPVEGIDHPCDESKASLTSSIDDQQHTKNCSSVSIITENNPGNTQIPTDQTMVHAIPETQDRADEAQMLASSCSPVSNHLCPIEEKASQDCKEALAPTKSPFSPQSNYIDILELAEHIETSSSPFPKEKYSDPVLISPDEMKTLTRKIRDPTLSSFHPMYLGDEEEDAECTKATIVQENVQIPSKIAFSPAESSEEKIRENSIAKSLSSSRLVSIESTKSSHSPENMISTESVGLDVSDEASGILDKTEVNGVPVSVADSLSSASLLVSLDDKSEINSIESDLANGIQERATPSRESNNMEDFSANIEPDRREESEGKLEDRKEKEIQVHTIKHNVIQELKSSTRFKFKKSRAASSFADELAVVTGHSKDLTGALQMENSTDFASSLAKRVAQKKECNTPVKKKSNRKVLKPVDMSPPPQSTDTEISELLSDYW